MLDILDFICKSIGLIAMLFPHDKYDSRIIKSDAHAAQIQ